MRTGGNDRHTFVPARLARGVLPDALLEKYMLWRREDGTLYGEPSGDVKTERLEVSTAAGGGATVRRRSHRKLALAHARGHGAQRIL